MKHLQLQTAIGVKSTIRYQLVQWTLLICLESQQTDPTLNSEVDRKPMERLERGKTRGCDRNPGHNPRQKILNLLKSSDVLVHKTIEKRVAVVQSASNEGCRQGLCTI